MAATQIEVAEVNEERDLLKQELHSTLVQQHHLEQECSQLKVIRRNPQ